MYRTEFVGINLMEIQRNEAVNIEETSAIYEEIDLIDQDGIGEVGVFNIKANPAYETHVVVMNQTRVAHQTDQTSNSEKAIVS